MKFMLKITMGNDAVQTGGDVEEIIRTQLDEIGYYAEPPVISRLIRDINGATIGHWEFRDDDDPFPDTGRMTASDIANNEWPPGTYFTIE